MQQALRRFISVLLIVIFFLGSGGGQIIHAIFHNHGFGNPYETSTSVSSPHNYCTALQLMLPAFSKSPVVHVPNKTCSQVSLYTHLSVSISYSYSFKTSDRAPPVLA